MTYDRHMSIFQPITSSFRWRTEVFKIKGFVRKRFLRSPPPPPSFLFLLSPHFSRGRNAENPVFRSFLHGNACYAGYTVCYSNKFHFRFVFTILLQLTTQEIRERTIKEQENLYNSEMHRYDQHGNSPHNGNALPNGKVTRT